MPGQGRLCDAGFARGMRTLWISPAILGRDRLIEALVVMLSGSVALLGDTIHNAADALTALPLGVVFWLGRRPATRRYTYGYGRAEDLAGIAIVVTIAASSALAAYTAIDRLIHPQTVSHLWVVAVAALVGFAATSGWPVPHQHGRRIGSAALWRTGCMRAPTGSPRWPSCRCGRCGDRLEVGGPGGRPADHGGDPRGAARRREAGLSEVDGRGRPGGHRRRRGRARRRAGGARGRAVKMRWIGTRCARRRTSWWTRISRWSRRMPWRWRQSTR